MIDFHSHILPNIDDGSSSIEETLSMLLKEKEDGVTDIVATPHYHADRHSIDGFLKRRNQAYEDLQQCLTADEVCIHRGAEVFYFTNIGEASMLSKLCIEDTRTILLEMPFVQWDNKMIKDVEKIVNHQEIQVILAHIERYYEYQKDKDAYYELLSLPVLGQVNTGPLLKLRRRKLILKLLEDGWANLLGSDCHNMSSRVPNLLDGRKVIEKKLGANMLQQIDKIGQQVLNMECNEQ